MDAATTIRFSELIIGLVNFAEFLAFALPVTGLIACGLILTSRHINRQQDNTGRAPAKAPSRIPATCHPQPKPVSALIVAT